MLPWVISRRTFLAGGAAAGVVAAAGLVFADPTLRHDARQLIHPDPEPAHRVPSIPRGQVIEGVFHSTSMGRSTGWSIAYPHGTALGTALPMLLVLHGRGDDHRDVLGTHQLGAFLSDTIRTGARPFAVVGVDGGDHSYWHRRQSGEDPQAMILDELLPVLAGHGLQTARFGVGGWSMGGYGALLLAERLGPARVAVCAVDSPALWLHAGDSASGAFDGRADFDAHDVITQRARLAGIPVRVACGTSDPFLPGVQAFLRAVPSAASDLSPGAHNLAFWQHAAPAQLVFVGQHLSSA
jgi:enterochelin esterase-like enzyme